MSATISRGAALVRACLDRRARAFTALALCSIALAACEDASAPQEPDAPPTVRYAAAAADGAGDVIPDEYIVVFRDSVRDVPARARELAAAHGGTVRFTYTSAIKGFAAHMSAAAVDALSRNPAVALVEPDGIARQSDVQTSAKWGLDRIDQRALPLDLTYSYANSGGGVTVYILDTGIRSTHVEFGGRVRSGWTAFNDGYGTEDCRGHGTHVAGIVGSGKYGVAKGVTLYSVRVLNCDGTGTYSSIIGGIDWVTKNRSLPAVANLSLTAGNSSTVAQAVQNSIAAGVVYAVAAGNNSQDACVGTPANVPGVLTVGASDNYDAQATFSNYGKCVALYAPGVHISSTFFSSDSAWAAYSGTSQAAPHVAGVAALYLASQPGATPADVNAAIVGAATTGLLTSLGAGSPNRLLYSAFVGGSSTTTPTTPDTSVTSPAPTDTTPTTSPSPTTTPVVDQPPVASFTSSCPRGKCSFDANGSGDDNGIVNYAWDFGDGTAPLTGAGQTVVAYSYAAAGSYVVRLTVTDGAGQRSSASQTVTIKRVRR